MRRLTIRARLTAVYGALFLVAGLLVLGTTHALVAQRMPAGRELSGAETNVDDSGAAHTGGAATVRDLRSVQDETREEALTALLTQGGIALAVIGAASVAFGWLIAGRLLQPLQRVTETARRIADAPAADRGLHERIALTGPRDEVTRLADTFDLMLERLDHAFDGQRRFIADASHELRTPLALNRALLDVALHRAGSSAEVRALAETLLEVNGRHERLIDGLLLLARSRHDPGERSFVDLADIVEHVVAAGDGEAGGPPVCAETAEAAVRGNPVLLERLVHNLVQNGRRHNTGDGDRWVRVTTRTEPDGSAVLTVANTGPVLAPYEVPDLFAPFHRGKRSAGGNGAGLGLSIVRAVARAHGGAAHAVARDGGGLVVEVRLPGAEEDAEAS